MSESTYPIQIDTFTIKVDNVDRILAQHPNKLQDSVVAIETELGEGGVKGIHSSLKDRLSNSHDTYGNNIDWYVNNSGITLSIGDVVVFDKTTSNSVTISGGLGNEFVVGAVTELTSNGSLAPIVSNGKVTAKIYAETGDINIGDWLTTSSIPGFATKATNDTRTYFARATNTLASGTSGLQIISIGITNGSIIAHSHSNNFGDGGPLGDDVVDNRVLKNDEDYVVRSLLADNLSGANLIITNSAIISGNLTVLGKETVTETEIISGSMISTSNLDVYGNANLGNENTDETTIYGSLNVAYEPYIDNSDATIYFGKTGGSWNSIDYSSDDNTTYTSGVWSFESATVSDAPTGLNDITNKQYVDTLVALVTGGTIQSLSSVLSVGNDAGNYQIKNIAEPTDSKDATTKNYVDNVISIVGTVGETVSAGQPVYQDSATGLWYLAQAISGKTTMLSISKTDCSSGNSGNFVRYDQIENQTLPANSELYLSQNSAGSITSTAPSSGIVAFLGTSQGTSLFNVGIGLIAYDSSSTSPSGGGSGGTGLTWNEVTGTSQTISPNNGYVANNSSLVTLTLPTTCSFGSTIAIAGKGNGGWKIAQNSGQTIHFGVLDTTIGSSGYLQYQHKYDYVELLCFTANTDFIVTSSMGNIIVN